MAAYDGRSEDQIMASNNQTASATRQPTPEEKLAAVKQGQLNGQKPIWNGSTFDYVPLTNEEMAQQQLVTSQQQTGVNVPPPVPTLQDMQFDLQRYQNPAPLAAPVSAQSNLAAAGARGIGGFAAPTALGSAPVAAVAPQAPNGLAGTFDQRGLVGAGGPTAVGGATSANPEAGGPAEVDRSKIDALLGNVSKANSGLMGIAQNDSQYSAAQAQLAIGTAQAQRNAISQARSGNRRDSAALGARALQTNADLGAEATRSAALLRANEEDANRKLKLDAYKAAGDLGLNASALEVNVADLNMKSATNYLNNLFETNRLNLQIDEQEAGRVTNFVRDMALISKDYYSLSLQEQASVRDDLTRRYGISENTKNELAKLDNEPGFWEKAALGIVSGAGQGATSALTTFALSDERMKTDIQDATESELDELLTNVGAQTYTYTGKRAEQGPQFGLMAQDLKRSKLGRGMVEETTDGTLIVDGAKAGLAALASVSAIWKHLESAL